MMDIEKAQRTILLFNSKLTRFTNERRNRNVNFNLISDGSGNVYIGLNREPPTSDINVMIGELNEIKKFFEDLKN